MTLHLDKGVLVEGQSLEEVLGMKFAPLILANLGRKKIRTLLTLGSFAVAMLLFGLLIAIRGAFNQGVDVAARTG
jgi:hypothetical protein